MHSTIFVMDNNPVSRYHNYFDDEELASKMIYDRGYDYWCETDLEAEEKSCFSGTLEKYFKANSAAVLLLALFY